MGPGDVFTFSYNIPKSTLLSQWQASPFQYSWLMIVAHRSRGHCQTWLRYGQVHTALSVACISVLIFIANDSSS
jgi:hypothetical protein